MSIDILVPRAFLRYLMWFRRLAGNEIFALIAMLLVVGWLEALGIAFFFPLFQHGGALGGDLLSQTLATLFRWAHVPMTPVGALPAIVVLFFAKGLVQFGATTYQFVLTTRVTQDLRGKIVAGVERVDYRYVLATNTGFLTNLVTAEVPRVTAAFLWLTRTFPPILTSLVFFVIVFSLDWRITLACLCVGIFELVLLRLPNRMLARYSAELTRENSVLTGLLIQTIHAFKYLRATARFPSLRRKIDDSAERLAHADYRTGVALALNYAVAQPFMVLFFAILVYYRAVIRGDDLAPLFVLLLYLFRIMTELFNLQNAWQQFFSFTGSVDIVRSSLAEMASREETRGALSFDGVRGALACRDLTFSYDGKRPVLDRISMSLPHRSMVALVGESGSGKSTLVDLLTATLKPTGGSITVDGRNLDEIDIEAYRQRIGFVAQESVTFDDTVANNITLWNGSDEAGVRLAAERAHCAHFIEAMPGRYQALIGDRGVKLSGGQRQRLAIARELYKQPDILILDEATSALDSESEQAIQASIDGLKGKMTIIIIAHRLSTVRRCDRIFVLDAGRLVEEGGYDELLARSGSRFRRMCELQQLTDTAVVDERFTDQPSRR